MAIRKILLPLTGSPAREVSLSIALTIARHWRAHVTAFYASSDERDVAPVIREGSAVSMVRAMFERLVAQQRVVVREGSSVDRLATASFTAALGQEADLVAQYSRLADLTVVPHPEGGEDISSSGSLHAVLFDSGRPVLIAPQQVPKTIGTRVCIAWNGTAEAAASVQNALPWMQRAEAVRVLTSEAYQRRGPAGQELAPYLALHGVNAEVTTFASLKGDVGAGLLASAKEFRCDFLTMGAYSHSRLRQLILGGVTRHVLEHSTLPVMMSR